MDENILPQVKRSDQNFKVVFTSCCTRVEFNSILEKHAATTFRVHGRNRQILSSAADVIPSPDNRWLPTTEDSNFWEMIDCTVVWPEFGASLLLCKSHLEMYLMYCTQSKSCTLHCTESTDVTMVTPVTSSACSVSRPRPGAARQLSSTARNRLHGGIL